MSQLPMQAGASMGGRSWRLTGRVEGVADGVIFATGTDNSGFSVFVNEGRLVFDYNAFDDHTIVESEIAIASNATELTVEYLRVSGRKSLARLSVDGEPVGSTEIPWIMGTISSAGASVGRDLGSPVSRMYSDENAYGAKLRELDIQLLSRQDAESLETEMGTEMSRQ